MIYKFRFEVCSDDNVLISSKSEESGNFFLAWDAFLAFCLAYARQNIGVLTAALERDKIG